MVNTKADDSNATAQKSSITFLPKPDLNIEISKPEKKVNVHIKDIHLNYFKINEQP